MVILEMFAAVLTVALSILPARGVIGRNRFAGVRTRSTMASDEAWREGHKATIWPTTAAAALTLLIGLALVWHGRGNDVGAVLLCALPLIAGALWSSAAANRAVKNIGR